MLQVIIAMLLTSLVMLNLFETFSVVNHVSLQQTTLLNMQDRMRFMNFFIRRKVHMAGNWSCLEKQPDKRSLSIEKLSVSDAYEQFGINAKATSDVLLLRECVISNQRAQYLPILFFIAKMSNSSSLFYQIGRHPREELVRGVNRFNFSLKDHVPDVVIHYRLKSIDPVIFSGGQKYFLQQGVLYAYSKTERSRLIKAYAA